MSAQLWSEVIRSFSQVEWQLYPKIFGLVERSWNAWDNPAELTALDYNHRSKLALGDYNHLVYDVHLPRLAADGHNFHIQQPGVKVVGNMLMINKVMQGGDIWYCFDDGGWKLYDNPIEVPSDVEIIKAKLNYLGRESNTTWLWR
jgi:hexosaminidase